MENGVASNLSYGRGYRLARARTARSATQALQTQHGIIMQLVDISSTMQYWQLPSFLEGETLKDWWMEQDIFIANASMI